MKHEQIKFFDFELYTLDFETIPIASNHIAYLAAITYMDENNITTHTKCIEIDKINRLSEYKLMNEIIKYISITSDNKKRTYIYCHNLTFDGFFIIRNLSIKHNPRITIRNGRIYQIIHTIKNKKLIFKCSYNLIPSALDDLAKSFINNEKYNINLSKIYITNLNDYLNELKTYCSLDSQLLYKIITKFIKNIKKEFKLEEFEIIKHMTISGLSYYIYKKFYLNKANIYIKNNPYIEQILRESYRGGICELYIPYGENLYHYDINSAYPHAMANNPMPVGEPQYLNKTNINKINLETFFGFLTVELVIDENTHYPFIGHRINKTTIYPTGTFTTTIFSEELKYAIKINQIKKYKIITAIKFKKKIIFKKYINQLFNRKIKTKDKTNIYIYKILMNTLYGRFALKKENNINKFVTNKDFTNYNMLFEINTLFKRKSDSLVNIKYNLETSEKEAMELINNLIINENKYNKLKEIIKTLNPQNIKFESAVQISAAITAYSRIHLQSYKEHCLKNNINIYYSDTDSLIIDKELDYNFVNNKIGSLKLEQKIEKAWFLVPKIYCLQISEKTNIIRFKGLSNPSNYINKDAFEKLLQHDEKITIYEVKNIHKTLKNMTYKKISIKKDISLLLTKRIKIYNKNNTWVNTKPIHIQNTKTNLKSANAPPKKKKKKSANAPPKNKKKKSANAPPKKII